MGGKTSGCAAFDEFVAKTPVYTEDSIRKFADQERVPASVIVGRLEHFAHIKWGEFGQLHCKLYVMEPAV